MISIFIHFCSRWGLYTCSTNTTRKKYTISSYSIWYFVIFLILIELSTSSPQPKSQLRVLLLLSNVTKDLFLFSTNHLDADLEITKKMNRLASTNRIWRRSIHEEGEGKKCLIWRRKGPVQWVWRSLVKSLIIQSRSNSFKWSSNLQTHRCRHYYRRRSRNR